MPGLEGMTEIGYSTKDAIYIRNVNLVDEIVGHRSMTDVLCLCILGDFPDANSRVMVDSLIASMVDHGLTPSILAARLTLLGAPESLQGAVSAGLLGAGSRFLGTMQDTNQMLQSTVNGAGNLSDAGAFASIANKIVRDHKAQGDLVPGMGHPIHRDGDPRVERLTEVARDTGFFGDCCKLFVAIETAMERVHGRFIPANAAGAAGAITADMGLSGEAARGLAIVARSIGLVAHMLEEYESPMAQEIWGLAAAFPE